MNEARELTPISPEDAISRALAVPGPVRSAAEMRRKILAFEAAIRAHSEHLTAEDFDTKHHFAPGIYMRELFIPKGTVLTGRIHKTEHMNILSQGELTVWTEDGMKRVKASTVIRSQPGMKRVGYAHEDSVWITVHKNADDEQELARVEDRLFADTFEQVFGSEGMAQIEGGKE
jgi:quercetin dioxygenase-like cupin family protein